MADPVIAEPTPTPSPDPGATPVNAPAGDAPGAAPVEPTPTAVAPAAPAPDPEPASDWRADTLSDMGIEEGSDDYEKRSNQLARYTDKAAALKAGFEAQDKIRKGEVASGLPDDPTDEQMTDWRASNGVPETADAYELSLDDGLVLGESDGRIMEGVYQVAHDRNLSTEAVSDLTNAMLKGREAEQDAKIAQDGLDEQTTTRQIKEAWGQDYQANLNLIQGLAQQLPESVRDDFLNARLGDGRALFNAPEVMVYFADMARKLNPSATVVPNSNNPVQSINDEIKALEAKMGTDEWHKDQDSQQRYMALVDARTNMGTG